MSIGVKGENLIFLISQMRGGSTLVQNILSGHPDIHTLPEPWVALPVLSTMYTRKIDRDYNTDYNLFWARTAITDFVKRLPRGDEDYLEGVRRMYAYLYECAMSGSGRKYFLDKGPRYYLIIPELIKVFPGAKFIILLRNPLAVLTSINNTWMKNDFSSIYQFNLDLLKAPRLLLEGIKLLGERCVVTHYEQLLKNPEAEVRNICDKLQISFVPDMLNYAHKEEYGNSLGYKEQRNEYKSGRPDAKNIDKWTAALKDPMVWRLVSDYLCYLGKDAMTGLGYSYEESQKAIEGNHPGWFGALTSLPLLRLMRRTKGAAANRIDKKRG